MVFRLFVGKRQQRHFYVVLNSYGKKVIQFNAIEEEARKETLQMLEVYRSTAQDLLAIPMGYWT